MIRAEDQPVLIKLKASRDVTVERAVCFDAVWGKSPAASPAKKSTTADVTAPRRRKALGKNRR